MSKIIRPSILLILVLIGFVNASSAQTKHVVEISKMKFVPAELNVKKGDTVVWINRDIFPHDVARFEDKSWRSSPLQKGQTWSMVAIKSEIYFCTLHVVMKGKIIVKK